MVKSVTYYYKVQLLLVLSIHNITEDLLAQVLNAITAEFEVQAKNPTTAYKVLSDSRR